MMQTTFIVTGQKPAMGKQVNGLLKAFDLGIEGVFVPFCDKLVATLKPDITDEQMASQPTAIKMAYQQAGCVNVEVISWEDCQAI